ncbi:signal recognition particle-docking protein FtsY [Amphritea sp. 1_MG-2023]|uniref:signal recognition particle-docking protein FtsY n=1 Tax=Amphritea sp. 1_MG-2023 TaxID=3062670 RepID=UPI0026E25283|nr:signal recognition particle-docking protein FtsY [Amphritea sp. 1_MG-2023]MDO6564726.1 signal recognition particle-docking protein FtsY [Amphritea sp. 1_MG-2023]
MFKKLKSIFKSEKNDTQKDSAEVVERPSEQAETVVEQDEISVAPIESTAIEASVEETIEADAIAVEAVQTVDAAVEIEKPETVMAEAPTEPNLAVAEDQPTADDAITGNADHESSIEALSAAPVETVDEPVDVAESPVALIEPEAVAAATPETKKKPGFFGRIKAGLSRTKGNLTEGLGNLFLGAKEIDDDLFEEIETQLLLADVGVEATTEIIDKLTARVSRKQLANADALYIALKEELAGLLDQVEQPIDFSQSNGPFVLLMVGVNGVGKTTTIGKLAKKYQAEGKSVMLAAGDTFRAAAVEQLQVWGDRNDVPVVAQHTGADSASVIYDALQSAQAKNVDVLIADTAGRLQNKDHLMQELEKVVRVMKKLDPDAPHEVMLVLDAGTGQNAMSQAKLFKEAVGVSGISLTKLDGTAKGGIIFAIAKQLDLPIRYIGVGEQVDDLRPFKAKEFVSALFD